ncbi:helix-turn-helix domain-containing protein [Isobaculum melis]|nr:helix-turn-helix domain-containing protein [Isobaculum melis]
MMVKKTTSSSNLLSKELTPKEFQRQKKKAIKMLNDQFVSTMEAVEILGISRRAFQSLVTRGKIDQIKKNGATLYFKPEIEERKMQQVELRKKYRPYDEN